MVQASLARLRGLALAIPRPFADFLARVADDWAAYVADTPGWRFLV